MLAMHNRVCIIICICTDTCNLAWQQQSSATTITAFLMSTLATILSFIAIAVTIKVGYKKNRSSTVSVGKEVCSYEWMPLLYHK